MEQKVVTLEDIGNDIALITMKDTAARNTFSEGIVKGLLNVIEQIKKNKTYKVIILTGYDNYFCCGGTKDELFAIYKKEIGFNDINFFTFPLFSEVPVISAMQGHGIGGGFVLGCYADFMILGKENIYNTNFMKYGFTPGMGGTYLVPFRLGKTIGNEMLYTAESYSGGQLQQRGIQQKVVSKSEVLNEAIALANILAEKPRLSLMILKKHLTKKIREVIPEVINQELMMHEITFHQPEVKQRIETLFGE
jgi:polyketide biosynthesis enoyl-CoA hydratase PksI